MSNDLIAIQNITPAAIFKEGGADPIIDKIRKEVLAVDRDISTEEGRKHVASLAYKVARSKTLLDEMGKTFAADLKKQVKAIDGERSRIWDALNGLQKEVRQPLTDFEEKEKTRIARHEADLNEIVESGSHALANWQTLPVDAMRDRLAELTENSQKEWEEFSARAQMSSTLPSGRRRRPWSSAKSTTTRRPNSSACARPRPNGLQREREEKLKAEAAEKARREAEEKAATEAKAAAAKAEAERGAIEQARKDAEERERKALADKKAAEEKAAADAKVAEARAAAEKDAAVKAERDRLEAHKKAEAEAAAKREADHKHKAHINNAALKAFVDAGLPEAHAKIAVETIAKGQVPHVKISY